MAFDTTLAERKRLSSLIASAALDPTRFGDVVDTLNRNTDGIATHIFGVDSDGADLGLFASGYDPEFMRSYDEHFGALNSWIPGFINKEVGKVVDSRDMCAEEDFERTEFYQDWIRPQGDIIAGGGAILDRTATGVVLIGGNIRRRDRDAKHDNWLELCGQLVPELQLSLQIARRHLAQSTEIAARQQLLTTSPLGLLLLDAAGRVRFLNDVATGLLEHGDGIELDLRGKVRLPDPAIQARLDHALDTLAATGSTPACKLGTASAPGRPPRDFAVSAINTDLAGDFAIAPILGLTGPALILTVWADPPAAAGREAALVASLGLTPSEAAVVHLMANGHAPRDIAELRSVSIHTIRNQIKSAMWKCGVSRQTQLVALALAQTE